MKWIVAVTLTALFLAAPVSAIAGDKNARLTNDSLYIGNADEYLWKANTLEIRQPDFGYRQQWVASDLIDICYRLAETKTALADAIRTEDLRRERLLERRFIALKSEEGQLWSEFDRLNK